MNDDEMSQAEQEEQKIISEPEPDQKDERIKSLEQQVKTVTAVVLAQTPTPATMEA